MRRGVIACAAVCWLAVGCAAPTAPAVVHVRDAATREPIGGATVQVFVLDPRHPLKISDMLRSSPPAVPDVVTGPDGTANIKLPTGHPFDVHVMAPPQPFESVYFDAWDGEATHWVGPPPEPNVWEVMISPR